MQMTDMRLQFSLLMADMRLQITEVQNTLTEMHHDSMYSRYEMKDRVFRLEQEGFVSKFGFGAFLHDFWISTFVAVRDGLVERFIDVCYTFYQFLRVDRCWKSRSIFGLLACYLAHHNLICQVALWELAEQRTWWLTFHVDCIIHFHGNTPSCSIIFLLLNFDSELWCNALR